MSDISQFETETSLEKYLSLKLNALRYDTDLDIAIISLLPDACSQTLICLSLLSILLSIT